MSGTSRPPSEDVSPSRARVAAQKTVLLSPGFVSELIGVSDRVALVLTLLLAGAVGMKAIIRVTLGRILQQPEQVVVAIDLGTLATLVAVLLQFGPGVAWAVCPLVVGLGWFLCYGQLEQTDLPGISSSLKALPFVQRAERIGRRAVEDWQLTTIPGIRFVEKAWKRPNGAIPPMLIVFGTLWTFSWFGVGAEHAGERAVELVQQAFAEAPVKQQDSAATTTAAPVASTVGTVIVDPVSATTTTSPGISHGTGAPATIRDALWNLVFEKGSGYGTGQVGKLDAPQPEPGDETIWFQIGRDEHDVPKSVLIAAESGTSGAVFQGASSIITRILNGESIAVSRRLDVGAGDIQLVHTVDGDELLVRETKFGSSTGHPTATISLPISVTELLLNIATATNSWYWPVVAPGGEYRFHRSGYSEGPVEFVIHLGDDDATTVTLGPG